MLLVLTSEGILWIFNPVNALDDDALQTAVCQVEAIINDQSTTTIVNGLNDIEPLTLNLITCCFSKLILSAHLNCSGSRTFTLEEDGDRYNTKLTLTGEEQAGTSYQQETLNLDTFLLRMNRNVPKQVVFFKNCRTHPEWTVNSNINLETLTCSKRF